MSDFLNYREKDTSQERNSLHLPARPEPGTEGWKAGKYRIALYSHDTMGLGHMRRNLSIAEALISREPQPVILMISGSREIGAFNLPAGADSLALPALYKESDGSYRSRCLDIALDEIRHIRESTLYAALEAFVPDIFIVDKEPGGAVGELLQPLDRLRRRGRTRCILGLRDIIDEPPAVQAEWDLHSNFEIIRRYYDAVWVYGDASVYNPVKEYRLPPDIAAITRYTGYLGRFRSDSIDNREKDFLKSVGLPSGRLVICTVGGGQDGDRLAEAFTETEMPPNTCALLLTGPYMPHEIRQQLYARTASRSNFRIIEFATRPLSLLKQADWIITMGGYNTVCEALSMGKRLLVVPRVIPRREQLIRAERMRDLGLLDMLHPDDVTPAALNRWLCRETQPVSPVEERVDLKGMERLPEMLAELAKTPKTLVQNEISRRTEHVK